jgi:hypothetical protein
LLRGAPRIHGELLKLGFEVSERTISRLMPRRRTPPSQTWRTFLENHLGSTVAIDFFPVAAGLFVHWGFDLPMSVGAVAMSLSTIIVAANAQLLRGLKLQRDTAARDH